MNRIILMICILAYGVSISWATEVPQAVVDAIEAELPQRVQEMLSDQREYYGLKPEDNIEGMTFCYPFKIYQIDPALLDTCSKRKSLKALMKDQIDYQWYSLVIFNDEARALISINIIEGSYHLSRFSANPVAKDLQQLFRIYIPEELNLFVAPYFNEYYFNLIKKDESNLTLVNGKGLAGLSKTEGLSKVKEVIGRTTDVSTISKDFKSRISKRLKKNIGVRNEDVF